MKKIAFILVAMVALAFTGCKVETSEVTVTVTDKSGNPLPNRYVFYADAVSVAIDNIAPSPEALITETSDAWKEASTNGQGVVKLNINLGTGKLMYYFITYDFGANDWEVKSVELHRGKNADVVLSVNK